MQLTAEQKNRIAAFLRKQDEQFAGLPADARVQALGEVKKRIKKEIAFLGQESVSDEQIESILRRMKVSLRPVESKPAVKEVPVAADDIPEAEVEITPATSEDPSLRVDAPKWDAERAKSEPVVVKAKAPKVEADSDSDDEPEDYGDRHWLGVCSTIADRQRMSVSTVRLAFIVFGLVTGPIALIVYCAAYFVESRQYPHDYPEGDAWGASWRMVRALVIGVSLYFMARLVLYGAEELYATYIGGQVSLERFGWVLEYDKRLLYVVLFSSMPMALLGGLPMAYKWDRTMGLLSNTALALYAVFLSLGVSSALAGYLLSAFQNFR